MLRAGGPPGKASTGGNGKAILVSAAANCIYETCHKQKLEVASPQHDSGFDYSNHCLEEQWPGNHCRVSVH